MICARPRGPVSVFALALVCLACSSCGYHLGGQAQTMPKGLVTIAILPFRSASDRYKLGDQLPQALSREFIARSHYHITTDPSTADAVFDGSINTAFVAPTVYDPATGKATTVQISVYLSLNLRERSTGRVLFSRPNFEARQIYEVPLDPHQFFDEGEPAFDRLCRDVARTVVSAILEDF